MQALASPFADRASAAGFEVQTAEQGRFVCLARCLVLKRPIFGSAGSILLAGLAIGTTLPVCHRLWLLLPSWALLEPPPEPVDDAVDLIFVAKSLERVAHHAVNLADYAFFERMGLDLRHTAR